MHVSSVKNHNDVYSCHLVRKQSSYGCKWTWNYPTLHMVRQRFVHLSNSALCEPLALFFNCIVSLYEEIKNLNLSVWFTASNYPIVEFCCGNFYLFQFDLQLPMHSVPIITNVVSSNPAQARCTWYNIMWKSLSVTCDRSVVFSGYSCFLHQ